MDSKEIIQISKRLTCTDNCNPEVQEFHIQVLAEVVDKLDILNNKIDKYETIPLLNGDNNNQEFLMSRHVYHQSMYNSSKVTKKLKEDFDDHIRHTFGKNATKFSTFVNNYILPIAVLISILLGIYSFVNNRSDFKRSDNLQKRIENTEKNK